MNLHLFLRSLAVAGAATAVIALATAARAEGGEASVVPIEEVHHAVPAAPEPAVEISGAPDEPKPARPASRSRAAKAAKASPEIPPEPPAEAPAEPPAAAASVQPAAEAPEAPAEVVEVEVPDEAASPRRRSRKLDRTAQDATRAAALRALVEHHAAEAGVPFDLADAVIRIESRYSAGARNGPNVGLTQINTRTAQSLGYQGSAAGLLDPETNLRYGLKYLARAYALAEGDTCGTILRYQAGLRARSMTRAARSYCGRVKTIIASAQ
ncbi:MAG TPA: lytic transglycosylase domain-containing protein [Microvirga sp.]|jgi:soluble lytic murein transglycosylase-like protein|nr:lytic transglycosylase domain-containing protein [Microvirga sp.]